MGISRQVGHWVKSFLGSLPPVAEGTRTNTCLWVGKGGPGPGQGPLHCWSQLKETGSPTWSIGMQAMQGCISSRKQNKDKDKLMAWETLKNTELAPPSTQRLKKLKLVSRPLWLLIFICSYSFWIDPGRLHGEQAARSRLLTFLKGDNKPWKSQSQSYYLSTARRCLHGSADFPPF